MRDYLVEHGMKYDEIIDNKVTDRQDGKTYVFPEYLQAMVCFLLSAQRPCATGFVPVKRGVWLKNIVT